MAAYTVQTETLGKNVDPDFYNTIADIATPLPFPSPVNDPEWLERSVAWFCEGETVMEVGPGRGEFAEAVVRGEKAPRVFYLVDMSEGMLSVTFKRIEPVAGNTAVVPVHADVDRDRLLEVPERSVDRIIMNNCFQDIQADAALKTYHRVLAPGGLFRANVPDREAREKADPYRPFFNQEKGLFYMTHTPKSIGTRKIRPLGYIKDPKGVEVPFYRIMKSYYAAELQTLFESNNFEIISMETMTLSKDVWLNSAAGHAARNDPARMKAMEKGGHHFRSLEVIARAV